MNVGVEQSGISGAPPTAAHKDERAELKKFCAVSACFLAGFLIASLALDGAIGKYLRRVEHGGAPGPEVQMAIEHADKNSDAVRMIFLGDSVSRQLFKPGTEPGPRVRFLTTNQAITMAGQCYLAEARFSHCPNITDVYLFYLPAAWRNEMPRDFTHDYFCGHFHAMSQVIEVFKVKRDIELSFAHAGRWLWPNIMAANSLSRPAITTASETSKTGHASMGPAPPDPERLLTLLSNMLAPPAALIRVEPPGQQPVFLSPVSRYYLDKLRQDCDRRNIRLHVLPCPVSNQRSGVEFVDPDHIYDGPIIGDVPANQLLDFVHFKGPYVEAARERMIRQYRLDFLQ